MFASDSDNSWLKGFRGHCSAAQYRASATPDDTEGVVQDIGRRGRFTSCGSWPLVPGNKAVVLFDMPGYLPGIRDSLLERVYLSPRHDVEDERVSGDVRYAPDQSKQPSDFLWFEAQICSDSLHAPFG